MALSPTFGSRYAAKGTCWTLEYNKKWQSWNIQSAPDEWTCLLLVQLQSVASITIINSLLGIKVFKLLRLWTIPSIFHLLMVTLTTNTKCAKQRPCFTKLEDTKLTNAHSFDAVMSFGKKTTWLKCQGENLSWNYTNICRWYIVAPQETGGISRSLPSGHSIQGSKSWWNSRQPLDPWYQRRWTSLMDSKRSKKRA